MKTKIKSKIGYIVTSGQLVWYSGYYMYRGHTDGEWHPECFVAPQTRMMLFKKDEKAPKLGSCSHNINWMLVNTI